MNTCFLSRRKGKKASFPVLEIHLSVQMVGILTFFVIVTVQDKIYKSKLAQLEREERRPVKRMLLQSNGATATRWNILMGLFGSRK
uniref:Uncharacterized protein n=1 Tax=Populus trichocarpa TaxID=3694 RepID=U5GU91_POPTR